MVFKLKNGIYYYILFIWCILAFCNSRAREIFEAGQQHRDETLSSKKKGRPSKPGANGKKTKKNSAGNDKYVSFGRI